jgi:hypothetical protein
METTPLLRSHMCVKLRFIVNVSVCASWECCTPILGVSEYQDSSPRLAGSVKRAESCSVDEDAGPKLRGSTCSMMRREHKQNASPQPCKMFRASSSCRMA